MTGSSPRPGAVRLAFPDASGLAGFAFYVVYRNGAPIDDVEPGAGVPPYLVHTADHRTRHCYAVAALLFTEAPPPPLPTEPACQAADGKPGE